MTRGCMVVTVKKSKAKSRPQLILVGGIVLYAPLACCSVRIDDVAVVSMMAACAPVLLR